MLVCCPRGDVLKHTPRSREELAEAIGQALNIIAGEEDTDDEDDLDDEEDGVS